ncbi:MAG TPA: hypothetical protein VFN87_14985 [Solirubrobacteraceae bacterium]|nr:hypothetical protein [Solirubrobacteraceae bacterium]
MLSRERTQRRQGRIVLSGRGAVALALLAAFVAPGVAGVVMALL